MLVKSPKALDTERKRGVIETLYRHSDLSPESISNQVDMSVRQVQGIIDRIRKKEALDVLVKQSTTHVEDIMTRDPVTLDHNKTVYDASVLMAKRRVGSVVVTHNGKPYGIVTERDIVRGIPGIDISLRNITLEEFASRPIIRVGPKETVEKATEIMMKNKIRRLAVVRGDKLAGIVTVSDLARFLSPTRRSGLAESILRTISRGSKKSR